MDNKRPEHDDALGLPEGFRSRQEQIADEEAQSKAAYNAGLSRIRERFGGGYQYGPISLDKEGERNRQELEDRVIAIQEKLEATTLQFQRDEETVAEFINQFTRGVWRHDARWNTYTARLNPSTNPHSLLNRD
jgi:hypothetical protein